MRYTVVWTRSAQDELAKLWIDAGDGSAVAAAADSIDAQLRDDASTKGLSVSEGIRGLFAPRESDCVVEVLRVRRL